MTLVVAVKTQARNGQPGRRVGSISVAEAAHASIEDAAATLRNQISKEIKSMTRTPNGLRKRAHANFLIDRVGAAQQAFRDFQDGPDIPRPNLAQSFIPVIGPAWQAAGDLQDGNYGRAAFNAAMSVAEALPVGVAVKGGRAFVAGARMLPKGGLTHRKARKFLKDSGLLKLGQEMHHTVPMNGRNRGVPNWRHDPSLVKALDKEHHRRLTGRWNGEPKYGPVRRVWYGTTDWQKAVPVGISGYAADSVENISRDRQPAPRK